MSVAVKMRHMEVTIDRSDPQRFLVPEAAVKGLLILFKDYEIKDEEYMDAKEASAAHLFAGSSKAAVRLRGFRHRDGLTQANLAKEMKTTQSVIASLESGKRPISYKIAHKLAKFFDTSIDAFMEDK